MEPIKILFTRLLLWSAQQIVRRYRPTVIGVTGSVGKTSAKEAIYTVLSKKLTVRRNLKSYNNDFGVPLTVIGSASGGRSVLKWAGVVFRRCTLLFRRFYPKVLVLEMGVDRPGFKSLQSGSRATLELSRRSAPKNPSMWSFFGMLHTL